VADLLTNHVDARVDGFLHLPTLTGRVLFVFVLLAHHRRRIVHFNVTEHPSAEWTAQQVIDAFPDDTAPRWVLRDRDAVYGDVFRRRMAGVGIGEVISSPSSPWQNPYAERLIGSIRRECLDHMIVLGEPHLRKILTSDSNYYHGARTHLSLAKDAPTPRRIQDMAEGDVVAFAEVGGLHHRYERRAASHRRHCRRRSRSAETSVRAMRRPRVDTAGSAAIQETHWLLQPRPRGPQQVWILFWRRTPD
jgi:hypothetical protein